MNLKELDKSKIIEILKEKQTRSFVVTPIKILKTLGFPVSEHQFILENKTLISNLKLILKELETEGVLKKRKSKQDFKGIKETAYDYIIS